MDYGCMVSTTILGYLGILFMWSSHSASYSTQERPYWNRDGAAANELCHFHDASSQFVTKKEQDPREESYSHLVEQQVLTIHLCLCFDAICFSPWSAQCLLWHRRLWRCVACFVWQDLLGLTGRTLCLLSAIWACRGRCRSEGRKCSTNERLSLVSHSWVSSPG